MPPTETFYYHCTYYTFIEYADRLYTEYTESSIPAFKGVQEARFESHGEMIIAVEEQKDAAASFLMTFILPLLIDELSSPQYGVS